MCAAALLLELGLGASEGLLALAGALASEAGVLGFEEGCAAGARFTIEPAVGASLSGELGV